MNEFGRGKTDELEIIGMERVPNGGATSRKLIAVFSLRRFLIELFQCSIRGQGILEIAIKRQANLIIDIRSVFLLVKGATCGYQRKQGIQDVGAQNDSPRVNIHHITFVHRPNGAKCGYGLLVQEAADVPILSSQIYAMVLAGVDVFLKADNGSARAGPIDKQGIAQKQNVTG